jgi:hypothetical protein
MWKTCTRVRWPRLDSLIFIVNYGHSWCLHDSHVSYCPVFPLQGCNLVRISVALSKLSDDSIAVFKHSNSTSLLIVNYGDDVDYFVFMA